MTVPELLIDLIEPPQYGNPAFKTDRNPSLMSRKDRPQNGGPKRKTGTKLGSFGD